MKSFRINLLTAVAIVIAGSGAIVPSAHGTGTTDFSDFKLITDRNIFDPNRYPHSSRNHNRPHAVPRSAPAFSLVGTMNYPKGMFAFFDGNNSDYRQVLQQNGVIAGYTVASITLTNVILKTSGTNATSLDLKIGDGLRLDGDTWVAAGSDQGFASASSATESSPAATPDENNNAAPASPPEASGPASDVLKRLMQQRAQEIK